MKPVVTIIMATYNRAHFIVETLHSIQQQTFVEWECIIVDEGSNDNTEDVIKKIIQNDLRFLYFKKDKAKYKKGLAGTRNCGLDIAESRNAEFIQLFDDDDIMHPRKIEYQVKDLLNDKKLSFTICKFKHYNENEDLEFKLIDFNCNIESNNLFNDFYLSKVKINSLGPLWRGNVLLKYRFDENLLYSEERDLYLRIFLKEKMEYLPINYVLFYYRKHEISNTKLRYDLSILLSSKIKSEYNLFFFAKENKLFNEFLIKKFIVKFTFYYFDNNIVNELFNELTLLKKKKYNFLFFILVKFYTKVRLFFHFLIRKV